MARQSKKQAQSFLQGAVILSAGAMLVKVIGAIFKIPLTNLIGELGMGYFNTAYQLYLPIYTVATAGFPIAVSKLVSQNAAVKRWKDVRRVYRVSVPLFFFSGLLGALAMFFGAEAYAEAVSSPDSALCIRVLAPTLFFCCLMSVQRGYYVGLRNMTPSAVSQVIEAVGKLLIGLGCAYWVMSRGMDEYSKTGTVFGAAAADAESAVNLTLPFAAAGAVLGVTAGAFFGFLYLLFFRYIGGDTISPRELEDSPPAETRGAVMRQLLKISVPVCLGALVLNLGTLIDVTFLQRSLAAIDPGMLRSVFAGQIPQNITDGELTPYLYGCYTIAQNVAALVPAIAQSFGTSALPTVTAAWVSGKSGEIKRSIESVVRMSALVAFPSGFGLAVLSRPVLALLFARRLNGVQIAAPLLAVLGIAVIFMTLSVPVNSMLQAVGRADIPVRLLLIGMLLKLAANFLLVVVPEINMAGACVGTVVCYGLITVFGMLALKRSARVSVRFFSVLWKPAVAGALCAGAAKLVYGLCCLAVPGSAAVAAAIVAAILIYAFLLLQMRALEREDILVLPGGEKVVKLLEKRGWMR